MLAVRIARYVISMEDEKPRYYWRVRTRYPERFGQECEVLVRSKMNSCLVRFADGFQTVTSRNYVRKIIEKPQVF